MTENTSLAQPGQRKQIIVQPGGGSNAVYGIGLIGAWVFYFKRASTNLERVEAFFKGLFWPAFVVHDLLGFLSKKQPVDNTSLE